ncbi:MAG: AMP-binding protein [Gammaproteobacteria bacterium]
MSMANYFDAFDTLALLREFPLGDAFVSTFKSLSRDELRLRQEQRFRRVLRRAWEIPFYQRRYRAVGLEPGDIRGLDDIGKLPTFAKADIMRSIEEHPPLGDFHGWRRGEPVVLHTTSGTTGKPQALLFGPKTREIQNLLLARAYLLQGLRADDVVHSVYGFGMINGGHYVRETFLHWTTALFLPAGTGNETPSAQQVQLLRDFGVTWIVGFADYIKRLAEVAHAQGIVPGRDIRLRTISGHLGRENRTALSSLWGGAEVYDWYGVGDTGIIACEGPDRDGLYVFEDAHYLELLDVEGGKPVAPGESGDMVVTVLFKDDVYPMLRFNTHDVSAFAAGASALGLNLRRIQGFLGRSDNMVKLRGINIFPQALGPMLEEHPAFAGEYLCRAERDAAGRDDLTVLIEVRADTGDDAKLASAFRMLLKNKLGIAVKVELAAPGALAALTGIESRQKPIRLIDERK